MLAAYTTDTKYSTKCVLFIFAFRHGKEEEKERENVEIFVAHLNQALTIK